VHCKLFAASSASRPWHRAILLIVFILKKMATDRGSGDWKEWSSQTLKDDGQSMNECTPTHHKASHCENVA